jgi:hypothetical protein
VGLTVVSKFVPANVMNLIALPKVAGVKAITAEVVAPLMLLVRVMEAELRAPAVIAAIETLALSSAAFAALKVDIVAVPEDAVTEFWSPDTMHE